MYKEVVPQIEDIVFSVERPIELLEHFVIYGAGLAKLAGSFDVFAI